LVFNEHPCVCFLAAGSQPWGFWLLDAEHSKFKHPYEHDAMTPQPNASDSADEQAMADLVGAASQPHRIRVEAQTDHLESLAKAKPINALSELIWNALDADADEVRVVITDNDIGSPEQIFIIDNGDGLSLRDAEDAFGHLGGSWKKGKLKTRRAGRNLHGRDGKGRFKAFGLGAVVTWETTYKTGQELFRYNILGKANNLSQFEIGVPRKVEGARTGTRVAIEGIGDPLGVFSGSGAALTQLSEHFAIYLRDYPSTRIYLRGERVDPASVQRSSKTLEIADLDIGLSKKVSATLEIIEWNFSKKERKLCLCDARGFSLHEIEAGVRPGTDYNFTAYLRSDYIEGLHKENLLVLEDLNDGLRRLVDHARDQMRAYFRGRKAESAASVVQEWKNEGSYPFQGEPRDVLDRARREVFDICALNVHEYLDGFREGQTRDRKFTLRMIRTALDENPEALKKILGDILDLPKERQKELADLLEHTSLSKIIEASKTVTDRLNFLSGLEELLFNPDLKKAVRERTQLHRILESESWIFGEEFYLTNSDESLTTVLRTHLDRLRPEQKKKKRSKTKSVLRDDATEGVIDLMLGREIPPYGRNRKEFLVVELKRPSQKIDLQVKSQIESYALAVVKDERFDTRNTHWTFIAVSNEMNDEAAETVNQLDKPVGFFLSKDNYRVGLVTWAQIIQASRTRLEMLREKLGYVATKDKGVALLHDKYSKFLPKGFANSQ
jgi:hypothetical protein